MVKSPLNFYKMKSAKSCHSTYSLVQITLPKTQHFIAFNYRRKVMLLCQHDS